MNINAQTDGIGAVLQHYAAAGDKGFTVRLLAAIERQMKETGLLDKLFKGCETYEEYEQLLYRFKDGFKPEVCRIAKKEIKSRPDIIGAIGDDMASVTIDKDAPESVKGALVEMINIVANTHSHTEPQ